MRIRELFSWESGAEVDFDKQVDAWQEVGGWCLAWEALGKGVNVPVG